MLLSRFFVKSPNTTLPRRFFATSGRYPHGWAFLATGAAWLDAVLAEEKGWRELPVPPMSLVVFRREDLAAYSVEPFEFVAQERKGAEP